MALGNCQDCREPMSDSAETCPHCGSTRRPVRVITKSKKVNIECNICEGLGVLYGIKWKYTQKSGLISWTQWEEREQEPLRKRWAEKRKEEILGFSRSDFKVKIISFYEVECPYCNGKGRMEKEEYSSSEQEM